MSNNKSLYLHQYPEQQLKHHLQHKMLFPFPKKYDHKEHEVSLLSLQVWNNRKHVQFLKYKL